MAEGHKMTGADVKKFRRLWDLSQRDLAALVGTRSARTVRRWEHGDQPVADSAQIIMGLISQDEGLIDDIFQLRKTLNIPPITDANGIDDFTAEYEGQS